ncbi:MAG: glycosyltransferase family 4 protein [Patescibacteria group bacterium]|nr:glycosyltransferase family 4 protein [Patescibacteria group bacterium]
MKIAQLSPMIERVPPKKYGGTERVVSVLTEELVRRGHEVTLFASGDSVTTANLESVYPKPLREAKINEFQIFQLLNAGAGFEKSNEFDLVHSHLDYYGLPFGHISKVPVLTTLHGSFNLENRYIYSAYADLNYVSISNAQRKPLPILNYVATIHHGIDVGSFPFSEEKDEYLLFVGRISPEKGVHFAIDAAKYLHKNLIIAAKLDPHQKNDVRYFEEMIEPQLGGEQVKWVGEIDTEERNRLMSRACCLLHPIGWREPFGLVMIEAMACGTPVIAFNRGSVPEVLEHGKTGYIVEDLEEMVSVYENISQIPPTTCRDHVEKNFSVSKMVDQYEKIYEELVSKKK